MKELANMFYRMYADLVISLEEAKATNHEYLTLDEIFKYAPLIKQALTPKETKFIEVKHEMCPTQFYCENCNINGNLVILGGWEEYCPICGYKITNKGEIK